MIKVLILTTAADYASELQKLLLEYKNNQYEVIQKSDLNSDIFEADIALIDENILDCDPTRYLAQYTFELSPIPVIYLSENLHSPAEYAAVKGLAADYLYKDQLTDSGLHNCIKYVLESAQLRKEIENQQKRYKSLFYNAVDPAFFLTPDWKIENVNQAFIELFKTPFHEIQGMDFVEIFRNPDDLEKIKNEFSGAHKNTFDREIQFYRSKRKGKFPGHVKLSALLELNPVGENTKKIAGFHGTLSDLSDQKRLQKIRESSDQLSMTYRLARTLAHEIRNPLTNITLSLNQLEEEVELTDNTNLYFGIIDRCTKRIDKLIDQLLRSSERQALNSSDCDLIEVVRSAISGAKDRAQLKDIKIVTDFETDALTYSCDNEKIQLAISNLLTNALESIESNEDGQVIVGTYEEGGYFHIYVEDNGLGMSEDQKESLFDPFFTNKKNGLGLGLTSTRGIVLEHSGQIEVESEQGVGSTFTISLPKSAIKKVIDLNN